MTRGEIVALLKKIPLSHLLESIVSGNHPPDQILVLAAQIVSAHVSHNDTTADELVGLIRDVYQTLAAIDPTPPRPASGPHHGHTHVSAHVTSNHETDDYLVCLEDGLTMKMLKRHLLTVHGLTPEEYRTKWNLPDDYPMVATNYAKLRSNLAKESGLGLRPEARPKRKHA